MEALEKINRIRGEALRSDQYLESLLEAAYPLSMLSDAELEQIQLDCLSLLARQTQRYNGGDSSSILIEDAQILSGSILFTAGLQLKTYPCPDDAVAALRDQPMQALYQSGRDRIDTLVKRAKLLHRALLAQLIDTENVFYRAAAVEGIRGFFRRYSPDFAAQEIPMMVDYPVYNPAPPLCGIEFLQQYLQQLIWENGFCARFSPAALHALLCSYDAQYSQLLFNLYEPVLAAALGCALVGLDPSQLALAPEDLPLLYKLFAGREQEELVSILAGAADQMARALCLPRTLVQYTRQSLPQLAAAVRRAVSLHTLHRLFLLSAAAPVQNVLSGE